MKNIIIMKIRYINNEIIEKKMHKTKIFKKNEFRAGRKIYNQEIKIKINNMKSRIRINKIK